MKPKLLDGLILGYGILLIALGVVGYLISKANGHPSIVSLVAGTASGLVVLAFLAITAKKRQIGRIGVAVVSLLMLGQFGMKAIKSLNSDPAAVAATPVWHVWTLALSSLVVFIALGMSHMAAKRERRLE